MATSPKVSTELSTAREIGAQARLSWSKKSELRIGFEGASRPEVLATLEAFDEAAIDSTAASLLARFS